MVANALLNNSPHEDTLGRSQKVGKEEIVGMVKALERFLAEDHDALAKEWQERLERISGEINKVPGVSTTFFAPDIANHVPHMSITWDPARILLTPTQVSKSSRSSKPSIVMVASEERPGLAMNSFMLQPDEIKSLLNNCREFCANTRPNRESAPLRNGPGRFFGTHGTLGSRD